MQWPVDSNKMLLAQQLQPETVGDQTEFYFPRVLFVEDDPIAQFVHKRMLRRLNCKVDMVDNGTKALQLFKKGYDVLLVDLGLPDKHGTQLVEDIQQLRKDKFKKDFRIIVLTANVSESIREDCLKLGVEKVLNKPIDLETLDQAIFKEFNC